MYMSIYYQELGLIYTFIYLSDSLLLATSSTQQQQQHQPQGSKSSSVGATGEYTVHDIDCT